MKYHFLDGVEKKRPWWRPLVWVVPFLAGLVGFYVLMLTISPSVTQLPWDTQTTESRLKSRAGSHGDRLFIPQINVDVAILAGDESVLERGAWHRKPENGNPVKGGNFVLSAHRFSMGLTPQQTRARSPFYNIDQLQLNDQIFVDFQGTRYGYKITKKYIAQPTQTEIEKRSDKPKLTLYSCTFNGATDGRAVFEAEPLGKVERLQARE